LISSSVVLTSRTQHQTELERLKLELTRSRQTTIEQADRLEKLKKQNDTFEVRIQDMKKSMSADQAEIKDLRVKLRMAEHERTQLSSKQGELETKKALQAVESRREGDVRERDRKIAELEKTLAGEKKKREAADAKLKEVKTKADEEVQKIRQATRGLQGQVDDARNETRRAQSSLADIEGLAQHKEDELVSQLEQRRSMLGRVAEEYGRLASVTVPIVKHLRLKDEHAALNIHTLRLERKLANSEAQVTELAHLVRYVKEQNEFLSVQLRDTQDALAFYSQALKDAAKDTTLHTIIDGMFGKGVTVIDQELRDSEQRIQELRKSDDKAFRELYRLTFDQLLFSYSAADKALMAEQQVAQRQAAELAGTIATRDNLASQLETIRVEHGRVQGLLATTNAALEKARADNETTEQQMVVVEERMRAEGAKNREALQREREASQRIAAAAQITKMSEEGLRAEIEQCVLVIAVIVVQVLMMNL
jgi:chromosome segregation ATPase